MANLFQAIAAPAGNGSGAAVDFSAFGALKTIIVSGSWDLQPSINIEINNDPISSGGGWTTIATFQGDGQVTLSVACRWMRATVSDFRGGMAPVINVGGDDTSADFAVLVAPSGDGTGASVDTSPLGEFKTVQVTGAFRGACIIEISNDGGATWGEQFSFQAPGQQSALFAADFMRVSRNGVPGVSPGLPIVNVGACTGASGGGGGPIEFTSPITPAALAAGDTNNYAPTGISTTTWIRQAVNASDSALTGLSAQDAGKLIMIENLGPSLLEIKHEDAGSTAANRFALPGETNLFIPPGGTSSFVYDGTSSRWVAHANARLTPYLNVKDFGAVGDGVTDDRAAIVRAMTAASGGPALFFPPGVYIVAQDGANPYCLAMPGSDITMFGVYGKSILRQPAGLPNLSVSLLRIIDCDRVTLRDLTFDGNWGNGVTGVALSSQGQQLPGSGGPATIDLIDATNFIAPGIAIFRLENDNFQYVSYTGVSGNQLTGCTQVAGTGVGGVLAQFDPVVFQNTADGINQTTQADPKNYGLFVRGTHDLLIERCRCVQNYGDGMWFGATDTGQDYVTSARVLNCTIDITARNGISFGAGVENIEIAGCDITNVWTCCLDSEPQGFDQANRDVFVHDNLMVPWPIFPGGGSCQAMGIVAGTPGGYNNSSAARGWRVTRNALYGWNAINNAIDVDFSENEIRTRFDYIGYTAITAVTAGTDTIMCPGHGMITGRGPLQIITDGALPGGVTPSSGNPLKSIGYYARVVDANNFKLCTTLANAIANVVVDITSAGTGTMALTGPQTVSPIMVDHTCDDIRVCRNFVYDNSERGQFAGDGNRGAIEVRMYSSQSGSTVFNLQPAGVLVQGNQIHAHKGTHGIYVDSQGGFSIGDNTPVVAPVSGTASAVTADTLEDTGAGWTDGQWTGWQVIIDGKIGLVASNTSDTLTIYKPDFPLVGAIGWRLPSGGWTTVPNFPTVTSYVITSLSGVLTIDDNYVDCGAYGQDSAGGNGVYLAQDRAGSRISVTNNKIKNATTFGIFIAGGAGSTTPFVELRGNRFWDDQVAPTMTAGINFFDATSRSSIDKLVMSNNAMIGGVTTLMSGVSAGTWLVLDGVSPVWTGYGSPEGVVTAPIGATYLRLDGSAGQTLYIKSAGAGNTGWLESSAPQASSRTSNVGIANTETVVLSYTATADELRAGTTFRFKAFCTQTGTNVATPTIRVRVGTTTLTGNIAATLTGVTGATADPSIIEGLVTVRTGGAGGTVIGGLAQTKNGVLAAVNMLTATVAVDTTVANLIELTLISGNAANTYNVQVAEIVKDVF